MALIVVLLCLALQRYLHVNSYSRRFDWVSPYYHWLVNKVEYLSKCHGFVSLLIVVLPVVVVVSLLFAFTYHLLGVLGYTVLNLALLWYCADGRDLQKEPYENVSAQDLFMRTYADLFAILFWYFVFGPVGLTLYVTIAWLRQHIEGLSENKPEALLFYLVKAQGVLDWVPVRLLGLSYALVGHFGAVFKPWMAELLKGLRDEQSQLSDWGKAAISGSDADKKDDAIAIIDRSLLVWLVIMALYSIGIWVG